MELVDDRSARPAACMISQLSPDNMITISQADVLEINVREPRHFWMAR